MGEIYGFIPIVSKIIVGNTEINAVELEYSFTIRTNVSEDVEDVQEYKRRAQSFKGLEGLDNKIFVLDQEELVQADSKPKKGSFIKIDTSNTFNEPRIRFYNNNKDLGTLCFPGLESISFKRAAQRAAVTDSVVYLSIFQIIIEKSQKKGEKDKYGLYGVELKQLLSDLDLGLVKADVDPFSPGTDKIQNYFDLRRANLKQEWGKHVSSPDSNPKPTIKLDPIELDLAKVFLAKINE